ncbi:MAG: MBL fold metallo-hydrolase [Verrucomicrobia bacterium]|nr:MBL fold metallo-hydrolase [Verrucomicrobiota bacterium]
MIAHDPVGLDLADRRNWRTRTSAHVVMDGVHFQIDAAPEFRLQCVQNKIRQVDYFILTHGHADHVQGMDDLRRFIDLRGGDALPVFGTEEGLLRVKQIYPYAIRQRPEFKGYPAFNLLPMPEILELPCGTIWSTLLPHGRLQVLGLVFEERSSGKRLAYYTDCKEVTPQAMKLAQNLDVVVLDALRPDEHPTHMSVPEAKEAARRIGAGRTFFTHMTYMIDHERDSKELAENTAFAYDGLRVVV